MAPSGLEVFVVRLLRSSRLVWGVVALVIAVAIAGTWPYWDNRFALDATTTSVTVTAAATATHAVDLTLPSGTELQVSGFTLAFPSPELADAGVAIGIMRIKASTIVLRSVILSKGASLMLTTTPDGHLDLSVWDGASLDLMVGGTVSTVETGGALRQVATLSRPVTLQLAQNGSSQPIRLVMVSQQALPTFTIGDQPVSRISFSRPRPAGRDQRLPFQSQITEGTLRLLDTGKDIRLRPRELVWLDGMIANVARIEPTPQKAGATHTLTFLVEASGSARMIGLGPPRAGASAPDRDLRPSVLDYILGQHDLAVIWTVLTVLLGALLQAWLWARKPSA